ncbi:MAG: hypothetical protein A2017_14395 [Lentisphaerae bacterium GWF2_44_16]|nr:MAG: hypothetical protein A2017_14395 [Lentisphaerae bacterium GWF2_44_16]
MNMLPKVGYFKVASIFSIGFLASLCLFAENKVEKTLIKAGTDKPEAIYQKGEKIKFNVLLMDDNKPLEGKKLNYTIKRDKDEAQSGTVVSKAEPVVIETELKEPGFALCTFSCEIEKGKVIRGSAGAAVDPSNIKVSRPAPEDFDKFWQERKEELAKVPMKVTMEPVEVPADMKGKVECFDIKIDCAGGMPVSGYFCKPVNAAKGSLPALVSYHGAGVRSSNKHFGYASQGMLALDINAHGIENGKPASFYQELRGGKLKGYPFFNSDDKDKIYFKGMFLRLIRSLEFIKSQPEWDGKILIVTGSSQGGAQSLVAAGIDPQVTLCIAHVPAMCDHTGILANQSSGWPRFIKMKDGKPENENILKTVPYFDAANFASRIKAETLVTVGFIDTTCAPTSVYAAYNNIKSLKTIVNNPLCAHAVSKESGTEASKKINEHLQKMKSAK